MDAQQSADLVDRELIDQVHPQQITIARSEQAEGDLERHAERLAIALLVDVLGHRVGSVRECDQGLVGHVGLAAVALAHPDRLAQCSDKHPALELAATRVAGDRRTIAIANEQPGADRLLKIRDLILGVTALSELARDDRRELALVALQGDSIARGKGARPYEVVVVEIPVTLFHSPAATMACPNPDRVLDYLARRLEVQARDEIERHIDTCESCRELLVEIAHSTELEDLATLDPSREPRSDALVNAPEDERYAIGTIIGSGGMGEVRLARDTRIQREVAIKLMRTGLQDPGMVARFFREARVQGGLEHPAVVPVHDLGIDRNGTPYFVMKRLAGTTLQEMLASSSTAAADGDRWRRQLLGRLADVCLAIEFAHTRGVIHRDLKPSNIMLGDFGEAYVLDWGLARIADDPSPSYASLVSGDGDGDVDDEDVSTRTGELLGTLGYMAPEQVRGEVLERRADVFGLGCILFEILAGEAALPRGIAAIDATLTAREHRPRARAPELEIPPELDDLCARSTAADPSERPTARALASGIQAYLDGDRDLARRRELAEHHANLAERSIVEAGDPARATAMREAGLALAVDPDNGRAQAVLGRLLLEAPKTFPAAALAAADDERAGTRKHVVKRAAGIYFGLAILIPLFFLFPTRHGWSIILLAALNGVIALLMLFLTYRDIPVRTRWYFVLLCLNWMVLTLGSLMFGPLLLVPIYIISSLAVWLNVSTGYPPWMTVLTHALAFVPFLLLEIVGVLPSTFQLDGRSLILTPPVIDLTPTSTAIMLSMSFFSQCASTILIVVNSRRLQDAMLDRVHTHTWHLEQLLPRR